MPFRRIGITFAVYGEGESTERLIPFDMLPRVFSRREWQLLDQGIRQRAQALNPSCTTSTTGARSCGRG